MHGASRSDVFWRGFTIAADTAGSGLLLGALLGSAVPIAGTLVGAIAGAVVGVLASPLLIATLLRRDLSRAFRAILPPAAVIAAVFGGLGFLILVSPYRDMFWANLIAGIVFTAVVFFGEVSRTAARQPVVWPPVEGGSCPACGYHLTGISPDHCPECGHDLARP
jgi:hypothetical protein